MYSVPYNVWLHFTYEAEEGVKTEKKEIVDVSSVCRLRRTLGFVH